MADRDEDDAGLLERLATARKLLQRAVAEGEVEAGIAAAACAELAGEYAAVFAAERGLLPGPVLDEVARLMRRRRGRGDALVHGSVRVASGGSGRVGERPLPRSPDPCRAVRGQRRSSSPHPEAAAPGDELGRVRGRLASARQPDGVVHGRGDRGLARRAPDHARRAALVLAAGGPDRADAAGRVPPRPAPDRGSGRLDPPSARPRAAGARPRHPVPPGRDAGGAATPADRRGRAPAGRQHRPAPVGPGGVAHREARHQGPPGLEEAAPRGGRRHRPDRGRGADRPRDGRRLPGRAVAGPGG